MARDMTPVLKRCRSLGIDPTFLGLDKKSNRNARAGRKQSEYGLQLKEKQKAKFIYGVLEKPFRNNFARAQKLKYGTTGENLMIILELRLDNVLFRMGYGRTRKESRQIIDHKHVLVNGKCVNIPSYLVKAGDHYLEYNSTISISFTGTSISSLVGSSFTTPLRFSWSASSQFGTSLPPVTYRIPLYLSEPLDFSLISISSPAFTR